MKSLALAIVRGYKQYLSPVLPTACRYVPTCSEYAIEAIERNGVLRGGGQAILRFLRCNPFGGHGYDPVVKDPGAERVCVQCKARRSQRQAGMGHPEALR
jgi:putative membrane protein insertion efficiency factor